jgi:hypothetical protein
MRGRYGMSSESEANFKETQPLKYAAWQMSQVYINSTDGGIKELNEEQFNTIGNIFGAVEEEDRTAVFIMFLDYLDDQGIEYDTEQFMRPAEVTVH